MKKKTLLILMASLLFLHGASALADDSDIFGANVQPNVMILIDSSGSMGDTVPSNLYDPSTVYPVLNRCGSQRNQACTPTVVYKRGSGTTYTLYANTINDVSDAGARDALSTNGFWTGRISGSNLNLFVGSYINYLNCTDTTICASPEQKVVIAKRVITNLINNVNGVRFGAMKFKSGGGQIIQPIRDMTATNRTTLVNSVNGMTLTSVGTVTGEQIRDVGVYYRSGFEGHASPIQLECQPSFAIVVSDGLYTGIDPRPQATNLFNPAQDPNLDLRTDLPGIQNAILHTIGFGLPPGDKDAGGLVALSDAARNGGGSFYTADDSMQLEAALEDAIRQIIAATFSFATPVIPTTGTTGSNRIFLAAFQSDPARPFWKGFLKAYNKDSSGLVPVDANGVPLDSALAWEAGNVLNGKLAANRTIYTLLGGARQNFTTSNTAITSALLGVSDANRNKLIDFIRGVDSFDDDVDSDATEQRPWKLGDVFHSTPVLVSKPFLLLADPTYGTFKSNNASRTSVLLAGANDGMLHAFRESDGEELWAFIPTDLLGNLKGLVKSLTNSSEHPFLVDSSPIAADICVNFVNDGSGNCASAADWKTIVISGLRRGGRSYFALDVTDPTNPLKLWNVVQSFTDAKMGETWSEPAIGKVRMADGTARFVAFVGGGYDTSQNNNSGKAFFAIDLKDGTKLWEYYNNSSTDDRQHMNFSLAANPTAVDLNGDGFVDRVYIGDVGGQVWKFDVSAPATLSGGLVNNWTGKRLFAAAPSQTNPPPAGEFYPAQGVYGAPVLTFDSNRNVWFFFGTGDRNHPLNTSTNRFYGIKDNTSMANGSALTESNLVDVTSGSGASPITQGWFIRLASNEKVLAAAEVFDNKAFFTTFTPVSTVACNSGGGTAKLYSVNMLTGDAAVNLTDGTVVTPGQSASSQSKVIGQGIPSRPIIIVRESGNQGTPTAVAGTTNQQLPGSPAPPISVRRLVGWREVF